ncbi:hypothetical protein [Vibrio diazotrophicus]|uniref:hypothetical protein n=1 Tax=Vibrio diazotrophicus TaxID=685 RepID=UPI000C9E5AB7|nr:hypothetical protein [Vibrio diazotrophicus]PNH91336.1 hypothetical protein C1M59_14635 [Vibrio diazotrophicus]
MKFVWILLALVLTGCATKPLPYDMQTSDNSYEPIKVKKNLSNLELGDFEYKPNIKISAHTTSFFGCLPCQSDGSTVGFVFAEPVSEIIKAEVKNALNEVTIPSGENSCQLSATVHLVAWDTLDGDTTVDLTYKLMKEQEIKFIRRIRTDYDNGLFSVNKIDRFFAKATRENVSTLVNDNEFIEQVETICTKA